MNKKDRIDLICNDLVMSLDNYLKNGIDQADTQEVGYITDMIKDLCEAKKDCAKTEYYYTVIEAMEAGEKDPRSRHEKMADEDYVIEEKHVGRIYQAFMDYKGSQDRDEKSEHLAEILDSFGEEMGMIIPMMDATERAIARNALQIMINKMS